MSESDDVTESDGYVYGMGFGLGVFSSLFASSGLTLAMTAWRGFCKRETWTAADLGGTAFLTLFAMPFVAVPMIIGLTTGVWLVPVIGYSIAGAFALCGASRCKARNPMVLRARNNNNNNVSIIGVNVAANPQNPPASVLVQRNNMVIFNWLKDLDLSEYYENFINAGYETEQDLQTLTEQDLNRIGVTKYYHIKKVLAAISRPSAPPPPIEVDEPAPPLYPGRPVSEGIVNATYYSGSQEEGLPAYNEVHRSVYQ